MTGTVGFLQTRWWLGSQRRGHLGLQPPCPMSLAGKSENLVSARQNKEKEQDRLCRVLCWGRSLGLFKCNRF